MERKRLFFVLADVSRELEAEPTLMEGLVRPPIRVVQSVWALAPSARARFPFSLRNCRWREVHSAFFIR